jgi:hypothetical protein
MEDAGMRLPEVPSADQEIMAILCRGQICLAILGRCPEVAQAIATVMNASP